MKLSDALQLSRNEQKEINGAGRRLCSCKVGNQDIEGTHCIPNPHCQPV